MQLYVILDIDLLIACYHQSDVIVQGRETGGVHSSPILPKNQLDASHAAGITTSAAKGDMSTKKTNSGPLGTVTSESNQVCITVTINKSYDIESK